MDGAFDLPRVSSLVGLARGDFFDTIQSVLGAYAGGHGFPLPNPASIHRALKARHYIRYADDFVFLSEDRELLEHQLPRLQQFLKDRLCLTLHPDKVFITTVASGIDFLGWVHFSDHRVLRSASRRRMFRRIDEHLTEATLQSYLGLLTHGNTQHIRQDVLQRAGLFRNFD